MATVLVCYVTPLDATADIAMTVAEHLSRHGHYVSLRPVSSAPDPSNYRAIVLGGAISSYDWDDTAVSYLRRCLQQGQHSVWLFHTRFPAPSAHSEPTVPALVRNLAGDLGHEAVPLLDPSAAAIHDDPGPTSLDPPRSTPFSRNATAVTRWADNLAAQITNGRASSRIAISSRPGTLGDGLPPPVAPRRAQLAR